MTDAGLQPVKGPLKGHGLFGEGHPCDATGRRSWGSDGHGKCSCGALSESLPSNNQRKAWHRLHKAEILAAEGK